jgi:peptide-methionine (R)-S-oxide reductase
MTIARRQFLHAGGTLAALGVVGALTFDSRRSAAATETTFEVTHTEEEWRKILTPNQFQVLRKEATERPFSSPLNDEHRKGIFRCAGCDLDLFASETKFDSGTGWPSFFTTIPGHVGTKSDYKILVPRTEYHCIRCGGHQGHVFDDGPPPTGQRWCNNGVALKFEPGKVS